MAEGSKVDKIVADTNIIISSIFWSGKPCRIIQKGIDQELLIYISKDIIDELRVVLKRDFGLEKQEIEDIIETILLFTHLVETKEKIDIVEDKKDNMILECAIAANVKYIVSGDSHLLNLKEFKGIKIVSADEFLR